MYSEARKQAIKDIKESLKHEHKAFIAFKTELNPIMKDLVKEQLKEQCKLSKTSFCFSAWKIKDEE